MILILVYTLSKTILGHSFFNYILVRFTDWKIKKAIDLYFIVHMFAL